MASTVDGFLAPREDWKVWSAFSLVPLMTRNKYGGFKKLTLKFGRAPPSDLGPGMWVRAVGRHVAQYGGQLEVSKVERRAPALSTRERAEAVLRACKWRTPIEAVERPAKKSKGGGDDHALQEVLAVVRGQNPIHPQWSRVWLSPKEGEEPDDDEQASGRGGSSKPAGASADISFAELRDALCGVADFVYWNAAAVVKLAKDGVLSGRASAPALGTFLAETLEKCPYAAWFYSASLDSMKMLRPVFDSIAQNRGAPPVHGRAAKLLLDIRVVEDSGNTHVRSAVSEDAPEIAVTREWPWEELCIDGPFLYRRRVLEAERTVAECIADAGRGGEDDSDASVMFVAPTGRAARRGKEAIVEYAENKPALDAQQRDAVALASKPGASVITGAAGSGKTTVMAALVHVMVEGVLLETHTMHKVICSNDDTVRTKFGALTTLIVDEASMVDVMTMARLVRRLASAGVSLRGLVFVGDLNQLPPIRMGGVLFSIVESGAVPVCRLSSDHRQSGADRGAGILRNMGRVLEYEGPFAAPFAEEVRDDAGFCVEFVDFRGKPNDELRVVSDRAFRAAVEMGEDADGNPPQLLCQINRVGDELNARMRDRYNPRGGRDATEETRTATGATWSYWEDDKVISTKNLYMRDPDPETGKMGRWRLGVSNGEIGRVVDVPSPRSMVVQFDDERVTYVKAADESKGDGRTREFDRVQPAYAISIHKFQGSEAPNVVVAVFQWSADRHSRQWFYTGCTRGKERCTVVGTREQISACFRIVSTGACRVGEFLAGAAAAAASAAAV